MLVYHSPSSHKHASFLFNPAKAIFVYFKVLGEPLLLRQVSNNKGCLYHILFKYDKRVCSLAFAKPWRLVNKQRIYNLADAQLWRPEKEIKSSWAKRLFRVKIDGLKAEKNLQQILLHFNEIGNPW